MDSLSAHRLVCFLDAIRMGYFLLNNPQLAHHYAELQRLALPGNDTHSVTACAWEDREAGG